MGVMILVILVLAILLPSAIPEGKPRERMIAAIIIALLALGAFLYTSKALP